MNTKYILIHLCISSRTGSPISEPGLPNSARISKLREVPTMPDQAPKIKYRVPISLWFVENNHWRDTVAEHGKHQIVNLLTNFIPVFKKNNGMQFHKWVNPKV